MADSFPTTNVLDNFTRADGALGADWAEIAIEAGALTIVSGEAVTASAGTRTGSYWEADTFGADVECFATLVDPGVTSSLIDRSMYLWVRATDLDTTSPNGYHCKVSWFRFSSGRTVINTVSAALYKVVSGSYSLLATTATSIPAGVRFGVRASGSALSVWRDSGSGWAQILSTSDSTFSSGGRIGLSLDDFTADAFGGGNIATSGPPAVPSGVAANFTGARIHVTWLANSDLDLDGYRLYRSDNGSDYTLLAELDSPGYFDPDLEDGHTYSYKVSAFDTDDNESALSDPVTPVAAQPAAIFTPRAPAQWTWMLADHNGSNLCPLNTAAGKTITYKRNTYTEASCTISYEDDAGVRLWSALKRGQPRLKAYRDGVLRFNGRLAPFQTDFDTDTSVVQLVFRSPFAQLLGEGDQRGRYTKNYLEASSQDAGEIAADLIRMYAGAGTVGDSTVFTDADGAVLVAESGYLGLDVGDIEATVDRDRIYQYQNVGDAISGLSTPLDGFDFYEDWQDDGLHMADFVVVGEQGQDRPGVTFRYGETTRVNVSGVSETVEPPINVVRVFGAYGFSSTATNAQSVGTFGEEWLQATFSDVYDQAGLDDKAQALLRPNRVVTLSWTPELGLPDCPRFLDDYGLGDTVYFYGRQGAWERKASARVNAATIVIDENGYESVAIPDALDPEGERVQKAMLTVEVTV